MLYQLIDHILREQLADPEHVVMLSGDDPSLRTADDPLGDVLDFYYRDHLKEHPRDAQSFIFIDEVHRLKDWQAHLKSRYDARHKVKFMVSGSSTARVRSSQRESLAGRILDLPLLPMGFNEFLEFSGEGLDELRGKRWSPYKEIVRIEQGLDPKKKNRIRKTFDTYLLVGGFPEWFETLEVRKWQRKLREDALKRVIYDDIAGTYGVRNPEKLERLLHLLAPTSARTFSDNSISDAIGVDNETAGQYVHYLKESFVLLEFPAFGPSKAKALRKNRKYVLVDHGLKNALERTVRLGDVPDHAMGMLVESVVATHLFSDASEMSLTPSYAPLRSGEVDYVLHGPKDVYAVEVKYRREVRRLDLEGFTENAAQIGPTLARMLTKDSTLDIGAGAEDSVALPAWLFLACTS
jgi:hypothetical protein